MKNLTSYLIIFLLLCSNRILAQLPKIEFYSNQTVSFQEMTGEYQKIDSLSEYMNLQIAGYSDEGNPIHLLVVNKHKNFVPPANNKGKNAVWLIMNGIHPGESEGIDATLIYLKALAKNPKLIPDSVTILVIPSYNVDGMRNRKAFTRANQNGPEEKGFRASASNYDLNRDFLKADSKNTFVFYQIFHQWQPEVYLDTHTSNGADYQYTMTLISTQKQKLGGPAADLIYENMNPYLFKEMKKRGFEMSPYVNVFAKSPDEEGFEVFIESPKFSTGYCALFGTLGFVAETHMLKKYSQRVIATYNLLETFQNYINKNRSVLVRTKEKQNDWILAQKSYNSNYKVSRDSHQDLSFKGFELEKKVSSVGDYERNFYNKNRPFERTVPYYDSCYSSFSALIPAYFIIPQSWSKAIERLEANHIIKTKLENDTVIEVSAKYITQIKYATRPYEGHFVHNEITCEARKMKIQFYKGDLLIPVHQAGIRYLMEILTPECWDGFMAWNFFDPILNEKEGYSDYAFEEDATKFLENDAKLKKQFEDWKLANPEKAKNKFEVLSYIYHNSPYYEKEHMRFPVYTIE